MSQSILKTQALETYLTREQVLGFVDAKNLLNFDNQTFKVVIFPDNDSREDEKKDIFLNQKKLKKDLNSSLKSWISNFKI